MDCHRQTIACETCETEKGSHFLCAQGCKSKTRNTERDAKTI
jgi:hypothetical protein